MDEGGVKIQIKGSLVLCAIDNQRKAERKRERKKITPFT